MSIKQPEAPRLAEYIYDLMDGSMVNYDIDDLEKVAAELRRQHARITELEAQLAQRFDAADVATAAQAVVDRWDTPLWKDVPATAEYIGRLRAALAAGQATAAQAGEYPALVCDYCGALTPDPWHSSGMLHGKMSKHIHSCDACAARVAAQAQAAKQQEQLI